MTYFIEPHVQSQVAAALFSVINDVGEGAENGVFFSPTRAVISDRNLLPQHKIGSQVAVTFPGIGLVPLSASQNSTKPRCLTGHGFACLRHGLQSLCTAVLLCLAIQTIGWTAS